MLTIAYIFLAVAIIAGIFGFGGVAAAPNSGAKIFFTLFVVAVLLSLLM